MAKKRRQRDEAEPEDDYVFPEFDEAAHIREELTAAKLTLAGVGLAVVFAALAAAFSTVNARFAFAVGVFGLLGIVVAARFLKIGFSDIPKKSWFGASAIYFFTWLAIWVLLVNPPISDHSDPLIEHVSFEQRNVGDIDEANWTSVWEEEEGSALESASISFLGAVDRDTRIIMVVRDNVELAEEGIGVSFDGDSRQYSPTPYPEYRNEPKVRKEFPEYRFAYVLDLPDGVATPGTHHLTIYAKDVSGNRVERTGAFTVQ